ncbi:hypothetical protein pipiens_009845 [Culex pipiens pipiens]|uniref:C2H2-type domain-containing protein n=1 Tax=Culex pipiens pipiens TaxID=38569 RepID=A0ABD1DCD2_CULPP
MEAADLLPREPKPPKKHLFQCEICDKILSTKQSLNNHKTKHLDPEQRETFRCEICEATFKSKYGLKYHLETKHIAENERKKLPCPTCGRIFKSDEGRKIHMTIQHGAGGPIFKCKECPMVFARKPHLDLHMATHGAGLHVCSICGKSYARLKDLSRHEATCGVKELCCPECGKQLRSEQALENHRKKCRSRGLRCEVGDREKRERSKKSDLGGEEGKVRMRRSKHDRFLGLDHLADPSSLIEEAEPVELEPNAVHFTPKSFLCEHCPLKFASKQALQNHAQRRHWEVMGIAEPIFVRRFQCVQCQFKFYTKQALQKHERRRHWDVLGLTKPLIKRGCKKKRVPKKLGRPQKMGNHVELDELPAEIECDTKKEEVDPIESEDVAHGDPMFDEPIENVEISEDIERNEEKGEQMNTCEKATPDTILTDEVDIKDEIEFGEYEFNYSTENDNNADEGTFELITTDLVIPQGPIKEEVDALGVEPELENNVSEEPHIFNELVIRLEKLDYSAHVESSSGKRHFIRKECEHCGKAFARQYDLAKHRVREHGSTETPKRIKPPPKMALTKLPLRGEDLDGHVCNKSGVCEREPRERSFKCDLCRKTYSFLLHLEAHYSVHPEYQNFRCDQCSNGFYNERELNKHKRNVHEPVVKPAVKKIRPFKSNYKNPFPRTECEQCGQTFAYRYRLALHRVKEHGSTEIPVANRPAASTTLPRNFSCDQCDKSYHLQTNLTIHKAKVHGVGEAPPKEVTILKHTCKHCKKQFTAWGALIYHRKYIHGESIEKTQFVQCPSCRLKIATDEEMAEHLCLKGVIRRRERPFKCNLCDKSYFAKPHLEGHYSVHPEYHNFKCDQCSKGFFAESELVSHKKKAHIAKELYYACETCNQLFKSQQILNRHRELHMGREYCCEHCGKKFKMRTNLKSHVYHVHAEYASEAARAAQAIPCTVCVIVSNQLDVESRKVHELLGHQETKNRRARNVNAVDEDHPDRSANRLL